MNQRDIETLKSTLTKLLRNGCRLENEKYGVNGRVIGVGFKPLWSNMYDSKIEKIELNIVDRSGRVLPFNLYNVIGYEVVNMDSERLEDSKKVGIDLHLYSHDQSRAYNAGVEKVRLNIFK